MVDEGSRKSDLADAGLSKVGSLSRIRTFAGCSGGMHASDTKVAVAVPDNVSFGGNAASGAALASPDSIFRNESAARVYAAYGLDETPPPLHVAMRNSNFEDDTPTKHSPESYLHKRKMLHNNVKLDAIDHEISKQKIQDLMTQQ